MIRCPSCGTLNQDSRKSCSNCGTTLPQTQIRCPNCGTLNPLGNVLCDNCNSRLIPAEDVIPSDLFDESADAELQQGDANAAQVKGISLPTRSPSEDEMADEDLPDWLKNLTPAAGTSDEDLGDLSAPDAPLRAEEYPDWLSDLLDRREDVPEEEEAEGLTLDAGELPDWFAEAAALDEAESEEAFEAQIGDESELPSWLTAVAEEGSIPQVGDAGEGPPDWLLADAIEETPSEASEDTGQLPDWLLQTATESGEEREAPAEEPLLFSDSELPDWLVDAQQLSPQTSPAAPQPDDEVSDEVQGELADEMMEAGVASEEDDLSLLAETEATPTADADGIPELIDAAWEAEAPDESESELPDWLTTFGEAEAPVETGEEPAEVIPELAPTEDSATAPEIEEAELPDWLSDLVAEQEEGDTAAVSAEGTLEPAETALEEQQSQPTETAPAQDETEAEESVPAIVMDELPDEEGVILAEASEEDAELPEWLRELDFSPPPTPTIELPEPDDDSLARAELPSWLQELAPSGLVVASEDETPSVTDELVKADIPDWVQALQPSPDQQRAPTPATLLPTPAEPEGPLEGIPGVLQPLTIVDAPSDTHPAAQRQVSEAITAEAQLWQELLEQPRMVERPVFHERKRSTRGATLVRLLVAAVLVLGLLGAFWLLPEAVRLSVIPANGATGAPDATAPGAQLMVDTLAEIRSGDGVIVAVEYGNAYAEEMAEVAGPILDDLVANEAAIQFVSTLPEGTLLGSGLAAALPGMSGSARYLAGNANGIAGFLAQPGNETLGHLLILSSSPERVRWWMEQVALANESRALPLTVSVATSASAGPRVAPYLQTDRVQGWLVGFPDALVYRALQTADNGSDSAALSGYRRVQDILLLGHWAAAAFLVIGLLVNLLTGKKGKP